MTTNSNGYNAHDHLVTIRGKDGQQKPYLPAAWRLYELTLRYPNANFSSDIMLLDVEHNLVVVKCRLYLGASYEQSDKKTEAMKSGPLSTLDKVETAAKARCARDFGISTELALDISEVEEAEDTPTMPQKRSTARQQNGTSNNTTQPTQSTPEPSESDDVQAQMAALKTDFEQLYPDKAGIWNAVLTREFGKIPARLDSTHLAKMRAYYLKCVDKVTARRASQEAVA